MNGKSLKKEAAKSAVVIMPVNHTYPADNSTSYAVLNICRGGDSHLEVGKRFYVQLEFHTKQSSGKPLHTRVLLLPP